MLIPIIIPKTKQGWKNVAIVAAVALIIASGIIIFNSIKDLKNDYKLSESYNTTPEEMLNSSDIFSFNDAIVFDYYATTEYEDSSNIRYHFLIGYYRNETDICLASLSLDEDDGEIFDKMLAYGNNRDALIGDCIVDVYATVSSINTIDKELIDYYNESVDYYKGYYDEITSSDLQLNYCFDSIDDYEEYVASEKSAAEGGIIFSAVLIIIAAVLLILGLIKRGPSKKQIEEARKKLAEEAQLNNSGDPFAQYRQNDVYYNPNSNTDSQGYYVPPQEQNGYYNNGNSDNSQM